MNPIEALRDAAYRLGRWRFYRRYYHGWDTSGGYSSCPECGVEMGWPHKPDCALAGWAREHDRNYTPSYLKTTRRSIWRGWPRCPFKFDIHPLDNLTQPDDRRRWKRRHPDWRCR